MDIFKTNEKFMTVAMMAMPWLKLDWVFAKVWKKPSSDLIN